MVQTPAGPGCFLTPDIAQRASAMLNPDSSQLQSGWRGQKKVDRSPGAHHARGGWKGTLLFKDWVSGEELGIVVWSMRL